MKSTVLEPTPENLLETLKDDLLERNQDIYRFTVLLNAIEGSYSIALDGRWGSGKTFFVKQTKMVLDAYNTFLSAEKHEEAENIKNIIGKYRGRADELDIQRLLLVSVYYDAWANDNDTDPLLSLVYSIMQNVATYYSFKNGKNLVKTAAAIITIFSGRDINSLVNLKDEEDPLAELREQKNIDSQIGEFLDSLLTEKGERLVIFVDELDRCKPDYAVRLLERIKHYFSNDRITFVFSMNNEQLQHTIKQHYGNDFDACRYLDRFFDLRVALPPAKMERFYKKLGIETRSNLYSDLYVAIIKVCQFELREITKFLQIVEAIKLTKTYYQRDTPRSEDNAVTFCKTCMAPILIGLKMSSIEQYNLFVRGKDSSPMIAIFQTAKTTKFLIEETLSKDEIFDKPVKENEKYVRIEDKINELYKALFIQDYDNTISKLNIGNTCFSQETREILSELVRLISVSFKYPA